MGHQEFFQYIDTFEQKNRLLVKKFWERICFHKNIRQKKVLDFGSGTGCLTVDIAEKGAAEVVGVEKIESLVAYSKYRLDSKFVHLKDRVDFSSKNMDEFESNSFDFIFSKDTFEHLQGGDVFLNEFHRVLKPGGELVLGFGPLWMSPFGDHGIIRESIGFTLPWLHIFLGKEVIKKMFNNSSLKKESIFSPKLIPEIEGYLNLNSVDYYKNIINDSGFEIISYKENVHESSFLNIFSQVEIPRFVRKYWVRNIYCRLRKS